MRRIVWSVIGIFTVAGMAFAFRSRSEYAAAGPEIQYVSVEKDVRVQVVDWGGSGRALVFIPGLGNTARATFDEFAPKFTKRFHAYGITRRGFGNSSRPASGYSADRLGDDVLAVIDALKLDRPVLVGHSAGGSELSSIASRYPDRVAGVIYLEAAYAYAYHSPQSPPAYPIDPKWPAPVRAVLAGQQQYTDIRVPALAIYAIPTDQSWRGKKDAAFLAKIEAEEVARNLPQAKAFEKGVPSARVIILPGASHWVFHSHEAIVLHEMETFLGQLK